MSTGFGLSATARASLLLRLSRRREDTEASTGPVSPGRDLSTLPGLRDIELVRDAGQALGLENPFFRPHEGVAGAHSTIAGRDFLNFSSYNYLGLNGDPRVQTAAKAAIAGMTLTIARDLSSEGIRVNTILPGLFNTPLMNGAPQQVKDALAASVPFPRRLGNPEEYANLALTMIQNSYFNGEDVRLDGAIRMAPR